MINVDADPSKQEVALLSDFLSDRLVVGEPLQAKGLTITPVSRALTIQLPGMTGGLVWNRPAGVRVNPTGLPDSETFIPIVDTTRMIVWAIAAMMLAAAVALMLPGKKHPMKGSSQ